MFLADYTILFKTETVGRSCILISDEVGKNRTRTIWGSESYAIKVSLKLVYSCNLCNRNKLRGYCIIVMIQ
jgi:hypothetical protein